MKSKILKFDLITDERFNQNEGTLLDIDQQLRKVLKPISLNLVLQDTPVRILEFNINSKIEGGNKQWRKTYFIQKNKFITWNTIKSLINTVKAPHYKFI